MQLPLQHFPILGKSTKNPLLSPRPAIVEPVAVQDTPTPLVAEAAVAVVVAAEDAGAVEAKYA